MYLHKRLILHDLGVPLPNEDGFSEVQNSYIKSDCSSIFDDYSVNANETWMHGDYVCTTAYDIFGHEVNATGRAPPDSLTLLIITKSKGFIKKGTEKISRSMHLFSH